MIGTLIFQWLGGQINKRQRGSRIRESDLRLEGSRETPFEESRPMLKHVLVIQKGLNTNYFEVMCLL